MSWKNIIFLISFFVFSLLFFKAANAAVGCCSCVGSIGPSVGLCTRECGFCYNGLGTDNACRVGTCPVACYPPDCSNVCEMDGTDRCPTGYWEEGYGYILHEWWAHSGVYVWIESQTCEFPNDVSEKKVVKCNGKIESGICGDTSGLYYRDTRDCTQWCTKLGDNECEKGCGADPACDEKKPQNYITPYQCSCGKTYFADKCDSNCGCIDGGDGICRSPSFGSGCTASEMCNGYSPGTTFPDICQADLILKNRVCTSTCIYNTDMYRCDSYVHTNCQSQSCGGVTYYCTYSGTWMWRTTYPTENCTDGIDNDCDGKIDGNDPDCATIPPPPPPQTVNVTVNAKQTCGTPMDGLSISYSYDGTSSSQSTTFMLSIPSGKTLTLTAPNPGSASGWKNIPFHHWEQDGVNIGASTSITKTITSNTNFTAVYQQPSPPSDSPYDYNTYVYVRDYDTNALISSASVTLQAPGSGWVISKTTDGGYVIFNSGKMDATITASKSGYQDTGDPSKPSSRSITITGSSSFTLWLKKSAAPFDFSLSVSPSSGTVTQGSSTTTTVTATLISGSSQTVTFSCSGLPQDISCSFSPASCNPTCSSTLTISTSSATSIGSHQITVTGTGGGQTRSSIYTLTVQPPGQCTRNNPVVDIDVEKAYGKPGEEIIAWVYVTNKDSQGCGKSTFDLSMISPPSNWNYRFDPPSIELSPQTTGGAWVYITSPSTASPGAYPFTVRATNRQASSYYGQDSLYYVICDGSLSVKITGTAPCTVTADFTATGCDSLSWQIKDDGNTKCSGTVSGNSYSYTCPSWTVGEGSYIYNLYIGGRLTDSKSVTCSPQPTVSITVDSYPAQGSGFVSVDNTPITTPCQFSWIPGSQHTLSANSPVYLTSAIRYVFSDWSDGGAQTHTITTPSSSKTYTANYESQVYLDVKANPSSAGTVSGSGWYDYGSTATIKATANTCYLFKDWTANWGGGYTGTANPASVVIDITAFGAASRGNPPVETANFDYNNGAPCGATHCSNSPVHSSNDECSDITCKYKHYGTCSNGNCVYNSEDCSKYDNNYCTCRIYTSKLREECRDYECVPSLGNTCAWTGDWIIKNEWTCDATKQNTKQPCQGRDYWCCYDNGYKWQTNPCGTCSYSLSISPEFGTFTDTTKTWNINVTDSSNSYCSSPITYSISYSTSGSCGANTGISKNSFSINRGSTLTNAFSVTVNRSGSSCTLNLEVKDPNGNKVASGSYTVSGETCSYSLSISPEFGTFTDTTKTWNINVTDSSNSYCSSPITYSISYSTSGSCGANTGISKNSFSINRGSTLTNAFSVTVNRSGSSCTLNLEVKDPNGNKVASGSYTVSGGAACTPGEECKSECADPCTRKVYVYDASCNCVYSHTENCNPFSCSAGSCTNLCSAACGADPECDVKKVGSSCGTGGTCDASCKCVGGMQVSFKAWLGVSELSATTQQAFPVSVYVKNTGNSKDSYEFTVQTSSSNVQARVYDKEILNVFPGSTVSTKVEIKVLALSSQEEVKVTVTSKSSGESKELTITLKVGRSSMNDLDVLSILLIIGVSMIFLIKKVYASNNV